jgi:hypothetical protein
VSNVVENVCSTPFNVAERIGDPALPNQRKIDSPPQTTILSCNMKNNIKLYCHVSLYRKKIYDNFSQ